MEESVFPHLDEVLEIPKSATMKKYFAGLWDAIFDRYSVIVDENDLEHVYVALHSYYEHKIKEAYDEDFRWNECRKNNFQLRVNTENFACLPDLLRYMIENRLVPQLTFNDKKECIIKLIDKDTKQIRTLWDVQDDADLLNLILGVPFSLHGRKPIPLKALCGDSENVLKTVKFTDIIRRTSENDGYVNIGKLWKKPPDDYVKRIFQSENRELAEQAFSKNLWGLSVISGEAGAGKSTVLDRLARLLDPKHLVVKCDLTDCVDDFQTDCDKIVGNPVEYFFNKSREQGGWDSNWSILDAIYEKQAGNGRIVLMLDSFERVPYEFGKVLVGVLKKISEAPVVIRVLVTVDPRNEFLFRKKFLYVNVYRLKELDRKDIRTYLKVNDVTLRKRCEETVLDNLLHLHMLKDIYTGDVTKIKEKFTKISDVYSEFVKHCMVAKGKSIAPLIHTALAYIFPEKHVNVGVNFGEEFPHRTIAEYLVAKWICDPENWDRAQTFLPVIFGSYKYNRVYKFLIEILRFDSPWGIPPLVWGIVSCVHSYGKELKEALRNVEQMAVEMGSDAFKKDIFNCPFIDLSSCRFEHEDRFLHLTSWYEHESVLKILLEIGTNDIDSKNYLGQTPLHRSCLIGNVQITKHLLDCGANPNLLDENGDSPLHVACREAKSPEIVKILLKNGADPNLRNPNDSFTSLHVAVISRENLQIVRHLLEHDTDPDALAPYGDSVLYLACRKGSSALIELLIDFGADPNIQNEDKMNCLHEAVNNNNVEAVTALLSHLADPNAFRGGKWSLLRLACHQADETMLKTLLYDRRVNVNAATDDGCTALHYASSFGQRRFMKILLEAGADPNLQNASGETPLHLACRSGPMDAIKVLVAAGADINVKTRDGKSCVDVARSVWFQSAIDFLLDRNTKD